MPTSKIRKKRRIAKIKSLAERLGIIFSGTVFVLAVLVFLARLDAVTVNSIFIEGNEMTDPSEILSLSGDVLSGSYVFLPRGNIFIYPKKELEAYLSYYLPHINSVEIKRRDLNTLEINIVERQPKALWCGMEPGRLRVCFYTDDEGFIYSRAPYFSGDVYFRYFGGDVDPDRPLRSHFAPIEMIGDIEELIYHLENIGLDAKGVHLREDDLKILLGNDSSIYLIRDGSFEDSFSRLLSLLRRSEYSFIENGEPAFSYIDLRFGSRIFYKLKEDE